MSDDPRGPDTAAPLLPSQMDDADLAAWIQDRVQEDWEASGEWREEAREAFEFVAGRQWDDADAAVLREQGRPPVTFDRTSPMIDAVTGAQVNNRQEIKLLPRSGDDNGKSELLSGVLSWVRDQCDAEDEESEAFRDTVVCGMGWMETRMDYDYDEAGKIVMERCDPFEMGWDRSARKRNLADANQVHRRQNLPREYVETKWPEFADASRAALGSTDTPRKPAIRPTRDAYAEGDETAGADVDGVEITHFQWCERRPVWKVLNDLTGQIETLDADQWEALGEKLGEEARDAMQHVAQTEKRWWQAFECGGLIADKSECPDPSGPTFKAITGRRDHLKRMFYGIVRAVIDPQKWANKWLSQALHIINTNAKSGVVFEEGAITDQRKFEESYAKTGSATMVAAGTLTGGRMRDKVPPPFPQAFDKLLQFAIGSIPDVTGINKELLGTVGHEQAGVLEAQRKQASQAVLAPLFDSLRRYYKDEGRLLLVFIQKYIPPDKIIRITSPDGDPQMIQMAMLPDASNYDIIVDQAPTSPNQKAEVWQTLQPALPALLKMGMPMTVWGELLRYSPLPESAVTKIVKGMEEQAKQPPPPDPAVVKAKADIEATQAKTQADLQMKRAEMEQAAQMAQLEYQTEMQKAQFDLELQRIKASNELQIAQMKAQQDAQLKREDAANQMAIDQRKAAVQAEASVSKMKAEKDVLAEPVREIMGPVQDVLNRMVEVLGEMQAAHREDQRNNVAMLAEVRQLVSAEKEVVRGPDGRVAGARIKQAVLN